MKLILCFLSLCIPDMKWSFNYESRSINIVLYFFILEERNLTKKLCEIFLFVNIVPLPKFCFVSVSPPSLPTYIRMA